MINILFYGNCAFHDMRISNGNCQCVFVKTMYVCISNLLIHKLILFFLQWDFEDLDQNWNTDSEVPSIQPSDSSVLNVASCNSELQFTSTLWPR